MSATPDELLANVKVTKAYLQDGLADVDAAFSEMVEALDLFLGYLEGDGNGRKKT